MAKIFGASWLTTMIGVLAAVLNILQDLSVHGAVSSQTIIQSAGLLGVGLAAKDHNVTGTGDQK
jgi:hypothetical protein